jgi:outer membrane protein assembly factor BamB
MRGTHRRLLIGLSSLALVATYVAHSTLEAHRYIKWTFDVGGPVSYTPILCADGTVITGSYDPLLALDGETGKKKWTYNFPTANECQLSEPVVGSDGTVYVASQRGGRPYRLHALDSTTGKLQWMAGSPASRLALGDDHVLFLSWKHTIALEGTMGKLLWTFDPTPRADVDPETWNHDGHAEAIAYGNRTVYVILGCPYSRLYALAASTGKPKWSVSFERSEQFACSVPASIVVTEDGAPVVSQMGASLCAYDARSGRVLWRFYGGGRFSSAQLRVGPGNLLYVGNDKGTVYALDARTGTVKWKQCLREEICRPPVISRDGELYVGTDINKIYALNAATGQIQWSLSFDWLSRFIPYGNFLSLTVSPSGMVYAASTNGKLYALRRQ